jgi:large subunit ribosomal protein L10
MAKTKQQKAETIDKLTEIFRNSASTVFVHFNGLTVGDETEVRRGLEKEGVDYFVAKKTLMRIASQKAKNDGEMPELNGEIALAYNVEGNDDPTAPARMINTFVKSFGDKLSIVGGVYENTLVNQPKMQEIATIPPLDVLRGMFANVINSPIQRIAIALNAVAEKKS